MGEIKETKTTGDRKQDTEEKLITDLEYAVILVSGNLSLKGKVDKPKTIEDVLFFVHILNRITSFQKGNLRVTSNSYLTNSVILFNSK